MTSIIITLLIVFCKIPLINLLGDKGIGYYSVALIIYLFLMTCISYGLPKAVSTLLVLQSSKGQYRLVYKTTISSLIYAVLAGGITGTLLFISAEVIAAHFMNAVYSAFAIRVFAPCLLLTSISEVLHGVFVGTKAERVSKTAHHIEELTGALLTILGVCLFMGIGTDIAKTRGEALYESAYTSMGAALGLTCGIFISCVFLLIVFINYRKKLLRMSVKDTGNGGKREPSKKEIIALLLKTMIPFILILTIYYLSNLVDYAIFNHIMSVQGHKENSYIILLGMLNGKYEFFISLPLLFVNWYAASKVSVLTKIAQENNKRKIYNKIGQSLRYTMLYIIPCTIFFVLYAEPLMDLLFTGINDTPAILLRTGAISIIFYSLAAISNAALNALGEWMSVTKNVLISMIVQTICLLIMMIIFQWGIIAVVISRILFAACISVLNEHTLREHTGYVQEHKRTFTIPLFASLIMCGITSVIYVIFELFITDKVAVIIALLISVPTYILSLVFLGGITQREMYRLPGGKFLAPLCRKLHLIK